MVNVNLNKLDVRRRQTIWPYTQPQSKQTMYTWKLQINLTISLTPNNASVSLLTLKSLRAAAFKQQIFKPCRTARTPTNLHLDLNLKSDPNLQYRSIRAPAQGRSHVTNTPFSERRRHRGSEKYTWVCDKGSHSRRMTVKPTLARWYNGRPWCGLPAAISDRQSADGNGAFAQNTSRQRLNKNVNVYLHTVKRL